MLRTVAAVLASMTLTTAVVTNAWMQKKQFYPTVGKGRKFQSFSKKSGIFIFDKMSIFDLQSPPNPIIAIDAYFIRPGFCSYFLIRQNAWKSKFSVINLGV